jgi:hypothetical protein
MSATLKKCPECGRIFDLLIEADAQEWAYGHDCEAPTKAIFAPPSAKGDST